MLTTSDCAKSPRARRGRRRGRSASGLRIASRVEDRSRDRPHQLRVAPADPAHADDSERRPAELDPEVAGGVEPCPFSRPQAQLGGRQATCRGQGQRQRQLGGGVGEDVRSVGGDDLPIAAGLEVDVVVADGEVGDQPQAGAGGIEQLRADGDGRVGDDRVDPCGELADLLRGRPQAALTNLATLGDPLGPRGRDQAGDQDCGAGFSWIVALNGDFVPASLVIVALICALSLPALSSSPSPASLRWIFSRPVLPPPTRPEIEPSFGLFL